MAYINGLRSFGHRSRLVAARSKQKKRQSTEKWEDALSKAECAHFLCRKAAVLAKDQRYEEAEEITIQGIKALSERSVVDVFPLIEAW